MPTDTSLASFKEMTPRQDATARLLLLIAKAELTDAQRDDVRLLASEVKDWDEFEDIALRKFVITFAARHLKSAAADVVPASAIKRMEQSARRAVMATLRVAAVQTAFHAACIRTTGARHAYLKGSALARQHGLPLGERFCRDVDVLVASRDVGAVVDAAVSAGYGVLLESDQGQFATSKQDIRFLSRYADVVAIVGPESVVIEIHRRLDKLSLNFDLGHALTTVEPVEIAGMTMNTLSKPMHFVYACYHHSRHFWSRLHWLADLDGMLSSPDCDREAIRAIADDVGIRPTVEAAFDFHDLVSRPGLWGPDVPTGSRGGQFLKACLINLEGDLDLETHLREEMELADFMSAWQISPGRYSSLWANSWLRRLRPTVDQYVARRRPPLLYPLYSASNALALARNALGLAGAALARRSNRLVRSKSNAR